MFGHVAIRDGDCSGALNNINETILTIRQGNVIDPNVGGAKNGDSITITPTSQPKMIKRVPNHSTVHGLHLLYANPMNDHVVHELQGNASTILNLHVSTTTIDGLVGRHHQLLLQLNHHATCEDDPKWSLLDGTVSEGTGSRVNEVVVGVIGDNIDWATESSDGPPPETLAAFGQPLAICGPVSFAPPATVNWVEG